MTSYVIDFEGEKKVEEPTKFGNISIKEPLQKDLVMGDERRIAQIVENVLNNARKYAKRKKAEVFSSTWII